VIGEVERGYIAGPDVRGVLIHRGAQRVGLIGDGYSVAGEQVKRVRIRAIAFQVSARRGNYPAQRVEGAREQRGRHLEFVFASFEQECAAYTLT
jgi:hypothetical protein